MLEPSTRSLFDGDLDPKRIISQIELLRGQTVTPADTLIIFDEIQEAPRGITSLKYFNELAPEYHIVAAVPIWPRAPTRKRVISRRQNRPAHYASHGVRRVRSCRRRDPLADAILAADMNLLAKRYRKARTLAQGIPCCRRYARSCLRFRRDTRLHRSPKASAANHRAYESDFGKHAPARIVERMRLVWKSLPGQLAKENKKFVYGALRPGARARDFEESLQWLMDYGIVHKVPRVPP